MKVYILLDMRDKARKIINVFSSEQECLEERKAVASRFSVDEQFFAIESYTIKKLHEIKFIIPLNPVTKKNHSSIITNKATNRSMLIPSKQYRQYQKDCGYYVKYKNANIDKPLNIKCLYFMKTHRVVDYSNLLEATMDMLAHYKVIADDNCRIATAHDGTRVYYDKFAPRTEITITLADKPEYEEV